MMITYLRTSLFEAPAQTLVNTVNTVGVMGKGIAKEFKDRFPQMFRAYKDACDRGDIDIGVLQIWREERSWILNFPTKTTWKKPSRIDYIEAGLETFVASYKQMGIKSVAFPPLGCGNGNLDWSEVQPLMEGYLKLVDIPVYIHDRQVKSGFVPEHKADPGSAAPNSFSEFLADVRERLGERNEAFRTISGTSVFTAEWFEDESILIERNKSTGRIAPEHLEWAWNALQDGVLTFEQFPTDNTQKGKSYLFAILIDLPYIQMAEISRPNWKGLRAAHGLFIRRDARRSNATEASVSDGPEQLCLYPDN
jgi:O-acetyl-ADP-ribose deacetylase (regulator of RNase III)